jgi:molybdopterin converting factor small subunit
MQIHVRLHGILRDRLPREAKGWTTVTLGEGATVADLLAALALDGYLHVAANEAVIEDFSQPLGIDDQVDIFLPVAGG